MILAMIYTAAITLAVRDRLIPQPEYVPKPPKRKSPWILIPLVLHSPALIVGLVVAFVVLLPVWIWKTLITFANRYWPEKSN